MEHLSTNDIIIYCLFAVVGYFLKEFGDNTKQNTKQTNQNTLDIQVLKTDHANKHQNMIEKFDMLNTNIKDLNLTIKELKDTIDSSK